VEKFHYNRLLSWIYNTIIQKILLVPITPINKVLVIKLNVVNFIMNAKEHVFNKLTKGEIIYDDIDKPFNLDRDIIIEAYNNGRYIITPPIIDREMVFELFKHNYRIYSKLPDIYKYDKQILLAAIEYNDVYITLYSAPKALLEDMDVAIAVAKRKCNAVHYLSKNIRSNDDFINIAIDIDGLIINNIPKCKQTPEIIYRAINSNPIALLLINSKYMFNEHILRKIFGNQIYEMIPDVCRQSKKYLKTLIKIKYFIHTSSGNIIGDNIIDTLILENPLLWYLKQKNIDGKTFNKSKHMYYIDKSSYPKYDIYKHDLKNGILVTIPDDATIELKTSVWAISDKVEYC